MGGDIERYLNERLGADRSRNANPNVMVDCIDCGKRNKMSVHTEKGLAYCFVCGYCANIVKLIEDLEGLSPAEAAIRYRSIAAELRKKQRDEAADSGLLAAVFRVLSYRSATSAGTPEVTLPRTVPLSHPRAVAGRRYLSARGFNERHWRRYAIRYAGTVQATEHRRYAKHLVFPHKDNSGRVVFFTTRATYEPRKTQPKTFHCGSKRLLGIDCIGKKTRTCCLVEGPMDMLALSGHAVCLLGRTLNDKQAYTLRSEFCSAILCLDADATAQTARIAERLHCLGIAVRIYTPAGSGDPADEVTRDPRTLLRRVRAYAKPWNEVAALRNALR